MAYEDQKQRRTAGFLHPSLQYCFQGLSIDHHRQSVMILQAENDICRGFALWSWSHFHEVSTPMRCIAPMDVVSKAELRSENTH